MRRALVTGGTSGIGLEIVRLLCAREVPVVAPARRTGPDLPGIEWCGVDLSRPSQAADAIARAAGPIDTAILCAGTGTVARDGVEGADAIRQTLRVNLAATILTAHALAPRLLEAGGTLVLVGSVARAGVGVLPSYGASKAGLHGFGRALGEEWRGRASVVVLHPGPTRTGMQGRAGMDVSRTERFFVSAATMARLIVERVDAAHGRHAPAFATLGHLAAGRRWLRERAGLAR